MEKILETKICKECNANFEIADKDMEFYDRVSPKINGVVFHVPTPTLCSICRSQRRLAYRNDRSLYKTICSLTKKPIISMYNPENNFIVWEQKQWWKDNWSALDFGVDFDFSRSFFDQFFEFKKRIPHFNLFNLDTENCEYVNYAPHCKNCYLLFGSWLNDTCFYSQTLNECNNSIDNLFLNKSEFCYENIDCNNNYGSVGCQNCNDISDCYFCFDCVNTKNCIGCYNLRNKEYCISNKQVTKEEFELEKAKFSSSSYFEKSKKSFLENRKTNAIFASFTGKNNENVSGDFIFDSKNAKNCFSTYDSENVAFSARLFGGKDVYDFDGGGKSEVLYENMSNDYSNNSIGCTTCEKLSNSHYCDLCFNGENLFGCIGLKNNMKYCILNKQYSKEEYDELLPKIIQHMIKNNEWGEFPSIKKSPFAYNETMAQEYYPLKKEEAIKKGFNWSDYEQETPKVEKIIPANRLPDDIKDIPDDILNRAVECEITKKPFRIIAQELEFYRKLNLPIPRKHPDQRHIERMSLRNPRMLYDRKCDKCGMDIRTTYSSEREEMVYCEKSYSKEVY